MAMEEARDEEAFSDPPSPSGSLSPPPRRSFFDLERHVTFLEMMHQMMPHYYQAQEINHLTLAYFVISGLDILNSLHRVDRDAVAKWVLSLQAIPGTRDAPENGEFYGFLGSKSSQFPLYENGAIVNNGSHLASTYCALGILKVVGYSLSNVDSGVILKSMRNLQQPDGSFMPIHTGAETDLRFLYCAAAICYMLGDWRGMDKEKAKDYILNCQSYDGGFGLTPGSESHGGATYCAVASLQLMGFIKNNVLHDNERASVIDIPSLVDWTLRRQFVDGGLQGRPNKPSDTCYAFWIGATLRIIGGYELLDKKSLRRFLLTCQSEFGGFSKFPGELPDLYHSYYGITAFSFLEEPGLNPFIVELGLTEIASRGL